MKKFDRSAGIVLAVDLVGRAREVLVVVGQALDWPRHLADQLAVVGHSTAADPSRAPRSHRRGGASAVARSAAVIRPHGPVSNARRAAGRAVDVGGAGLGHGRPRLSGVRVDGLEPLARLRVDPLAADVLSVVPQTGQSARAQCLSSGRRGGQPRKGLFQAGTAWPVLRRALDLPCCCWAALLWVVPISLRRRGLGQAGYTRGPGCGSGSSSDLRYCHAHLGLLAGRGLASTRAGPRTGSARRCHR